MQRRFIVLAGIALLVSRAGSGQTPTLVAPGGPLAVEARLGTTAVRVTVELTQPAALLALQYHPDEGWTPLSRLDGLSLRKPGRQELSFPRRFGKLSVPAGTTSGGADLVPDPGIGCGAAGGSHDPVTGHCGAGGSPRVGLVLDVPVGVHDYRVAVLRLQRVPTRIELEAVLRATAHEVPVPALEHLARMLGGPEHSSPWALLRIPRAP
jgi:hypothetical protein